MIIKKTKLDGVLKIKLDVFDDHRGYYIETYNKALFEKQDIRIKFIQDDISVSTKNVLRGIHGDDKTWKLISCLYGKFHLLVVNNDPLSEQFKKWESFTLYEKDCTQILIPPKFGNGHLVLTEKAIFHYKQSTLYSPNSQFTIFWDDPSFQFDWPIKNPILSIRDRSN
tara:strand:- start:17 stop:520 length:504 start_codon:yes stop_codon:yes gene_type:complete